ncbi:hypothetical protein SNE40_018210 [Patella caerulea]|uniref:Uncharacterized protein n=1 Tax=Patella caerulea TaxID=87958 RepID=A0AAN8PB54_PATCE
MFTSYDKIRYSHSRNSVGLLTPDGTSVMIEYKGIIDVYTHCCNLAESMEIGVNTQFEVTDQYHMLYRVQKRIIELSDI